MQELAGKIALFTVEKSAGEDSTRPFRLCIFWQNCIQIHSMPPEMIR